MADLPTRDAALLLDMLLAARDALEFVRGMDEAAFLASRLHQNAVIRSLEVMVEAAANGQIDWRRITGMRHRLIHGNGDVQLDTVWTTVQLFAPPLVSELERLVPREGGN